MKIIYVITKSNWGGAQRYVFDLATNLPKEQFEVKVVFGGTGEKDASDGALAHNLSMQRIQGLYLKSFMRDISMLREFMSLVTLKNLFKNEKPDIVHLNSSKAGGIGALAARWTGVKKIIFTVHGWPFLEQRNYFSRALIWLASWCTVLLSHKVICISEYDLRIAQKMPFTKNKVVRIYNGIAPMSFGSGEKVRNKFPHGVKITGTIGELTHNKNQITLIEEAKRKPDMHVAIVGVGEDITLLDAKIKEYGLENRVKLLGFMPAGEALPGFDTFALPSIKEGLPYVLLEAKQAGLPIIANPIGGIPEILNSDMKEFSFEKMLKKTTALYTS